MPDIQAFRGIRYNVGQVGSLSDVVAPPYDVIDPPLRDALYKRHPANVIRLILNRPEPGDASDDERYARAARFYRHWQEDGVLAADPDPALYVYHQHFTVDGRQYTRRGFMCRVRLEPLGAGAIYPHEQTHAAAKTDRLNLTRACRANLSQIFALYPDDDASVQDVLEQAVGGAAPLEATDHLGVVHRLWPMTDLAAIGRVAALMAPQPLFIADGHHRYETACNYLAERSQSREIDDEHPARFVLTMCVGMHDAGMIVLPTHRLLRGLPRIESSQLDERLRPCFTVHRAGAGPDGARAVWEKIETSADQGTIGLFTAADRVWLLATLTETGRKRMAQVAADHSEHWQGLGVSILHRLILQTLLEATDLPKPEYVHDVTELAAALAADAEGQYPLAALVMPATIDHIRRISVAGERMPAKSTYFYPKLLSGLVINPLQ